MLSLYKPDDYKRVLEAALLVANDPLPLSELKKLFDQDFDDETWRTLLDDLDIRLLTQQAGNFFTRQQFVVDN